ncbi:primosomal replication protein N'', partial [Bacillus thuringiensis]|nr:primosomal replication protein N'' [Bacillus thuringiensis]
LLQTLNNQLNKLTTLITPLTKHTTLNPHFNHQLFHTHNTLIQTYLTKTQHNFNQLHQTIKHQQLPQII